MHLIHNERLKLTANWLNTLAAGAVIAGAVTPMVAIAYGLRPNNDTMTSTIAIVSTAIWLFTGVALHLCARAILGRLRE
jgi:hypothetical protein